MHIGSNGVNIYSKGFERANSHSFSGRVIDYDIFKLFLMIIITDLIGKENKKDRKYAHI